MNQSEMLELLMRSGERERRLRERFLERGATIVQTYRHGPFRLEALFTVEHPYSYWAIECSVDRERVPAWTQEVLDRQLDDDLIAELNRWMTIRGRA
jgi:hypothetical protein